MATSGILEHVDVEYPTDKAALEASARAHDAPASVIEQILELPNQTFDGPEDVVAMHRPDEGIRQPHQR